MAFEIYIKKEIQNEIAIYIDDVNKKITLQNLNISDGLLTAGSYKIPVEHILFIKEV